MVDFGFAILFQFQPLERQMGGKGGVVLLGATPLLRPVVGV